MVGWKPTTRSTGVTKLHVFDKENTLYRTDPPYALRGFVLVPVK